MFVLLAVKVSSCLTAADTEAQAYTSGHHPSARQGVWLVTRDHHSGCPQQEVRLDHKTSCPETAANAGIRYANKLISGKGLALSVYDILTAEDGRVTWGNGQMYFKGWCTALMIALVTDW